MENSQNAGTHSWFCVKHLTTNKFNMINTLHLGIGFMLLFFGIPVLVRSQ